MRVLQFNIQSLNNNNNKCLLELFMEKNKIDIALITETWLKDNSTSNLTNFNFAFKNRQDSYGGVGIYLRRDISFSLIDIDIGVEMEVLGVKTLNLRNNFIFSVVYIPPNTQRGTFELMVNSLFTHLGRFALPIVVGGDFNARSVEWGDTITNAQGAILDDIASSCGFYCLNNGEPTFRLQDRHASVLDLTFAKNLNLTPTWSVNSNKLTNSNHLPVIVEFGNNPIPPRATKRVKKRAVLEEMAKLDVGGSIENFNNKVREIVKKKQYYNRCTE